MEIIIVKNYNEMSKKAASIMESVIREKEDCVLGLPTGSTPIGVYEELVRMHKEEGLSFEKVRTVNLDEYVGLEESNDQSYRYFMNNNLFDKVNIDKKNTNVPNGMKEDIHAECERYEEVINKMDGIDIQLLGIGNNGHIGFNEPDEELNVNTSLVVLKEDTIEANSRFFKNRSEVPKEAISMGIGTIMRAKRILLVANGKNKAKALHALISGKITTNNPASILQLHSNVTLVIDEEAASLF